MVETETKPKVPKGYLLMFNISKSKNFGTILRSSSAFNLSEIFVVEDHNKRSKIITFGSQGTAEKMTMRIFSSLKDVRTYCTE